jgi:hypothetical protein
MDAARVRAQRETVVDVIDVIDIIVRSALQRLEMRYSSE